MRDGHMAKKRIKSPKKEGKKTEGKREERERERKGKKFVYL